MVYFPEEDFRAITQEIIKRYPPGTSLWGTNQSWWKEGFWYVHGEDDMDMERIARSAATDPNTIEVISEREALKREAEARPAP